MNANGTYKNPLFALYRDMIAAPNQNFVEQGQIPLNNYYQGGVPNLTNASNFGGRSISTRRRRIASSSARPAPHSTSSLATGRTNRRTRSITGCT